MKTKTFISEFSLNKEITVSILGKDDYRYDLLKPLFEEYGPGFADTKAGWVFIDGEVGLNRAELKWIEAHEAAHIRLKHTMGERNAEDEYVADSQAKLYLLKHGYKKSAELVSKYSIERHGNQI